MNFHYKAVPAFEAGNTQVFFSFSPWNAQFRRRQRT